MKKIRLFFDFLSPYSYFAWINHEKMLPQDDLEFVYSPVLMGKLFSHHEFPGPGMIKAKRDYELKVCFRYAAKNNIEFNPPHTFPFNPLAIIRIATQSASKEDQKELISLIFDTVWKDGVVLEDPEMIEKVLINAKLDKNIIERSFEREAKQELKQNIKEALNYNIFGVPTFQINDEIFWGNNSFDDINRYLDGNDIWDKKLYNKLLENN